jgi:hypothetical protein
MYWRRLLLDSKSTDSYDDGQKTGEVRMTRMERLLTSAEEADVDMRCRPTALVRCAATEDVLLDIPLNNSLSMAGERRESCAVGNVGC